MKSFGFISLVTAAAAAPQMDMYEKLMSNKERTWEPAKSNQFSDWSRDDLKSLMGLNMDGLVAPKDVDRVSKKFFNVNSATPLPKFFDARQKYSSCIGEIRNQANCGSCWAFAGAETLSDNLCIQGKHSGPLSAQDLISCDTNDHGCNGGDLIDAWNRLSNVGIVDQSCMPYTSENGKVAACPIVCPGGGDFERHSCGQKYNMLEDELTIKNGIYQMGSAETGFTVYQDFMNYKSGIYKHDNTTSNMPLGGHAVKLIGWGELLETKYWLVANSWGPTWGLDGFFMIDMADTYSGIAIGGAFNCGDLGPAPQPPSPAPGPAKCQDILPSKECQPADPKDCAARHLVCAKTCGCCGYYPPAYCNTTATATF